jgi:quercetin dioxygenase-like cupin family protein
VKVLKTNPTLKGPAERFTGDVWLNMLVDGEGPSKLRVGLVRFSPGARTAWHRHAAGQTLHVTEGIGLDQTRDGTLVVMRAGDTVYTPPNEWHWHGATSAQFMAHLAISDASGDPAAPEVEWGEHVTDDEYRRAAESETTAGDPPR